MSSVAEVSLRPLAIPNEHGGWGFLAEPILLGLLVAPSPAGAFIAVAAIAAFLTRHPLKLAASDWLRGKRYPRTVACERLALGYGSAALAAMIAAVALGGVRFLIPFAIAAPLALAQFAADARNRGRALAPELAGAVAMGSIAAAMAIAGGGPAIALWAILAARSVPAILYVHAALRREHVVVTLIAHVAAIGVALVAWPAATPAMLLLLGRCVEGVLHTPRRAQTVGILELVYGVAFVVTCRLF